MKIFNPVGGIVWQHPFCYASIYPQGNIAIDADTPGGNSPLLRNRTPIDVKKSGIIQVYA